MPLQVDNRFIGFFKHWINLSDKFLNQKWLLYNNNELRFSYSKRLWQAIRRYKKVINKKSIVLRKRSSISIRFIFSEFALSFPIFCHIKRTLNVLVGNINFTISQILKIIEFFSLYMQFKNKGVGYEDDKKTKKNVLLSKTIKMLFNNELLLFNNIILCRL